MKGTMLSMAVALLVAAVGLPVMAGTSPGSPGRSITGAVATMSAKCKNPQCKPKPPHCNKPGCKPGAKADPKAPPNSQPGCCH